MQIVMWHNFCEYNLVNLDVSPFTFTEDLCPQYSYLIFYTDQDTYFYMCVCVLQMKHAQWVFAALYINSCNLYNSPLK
jgi:hypothetical protein